MKKMESIVSGYAWSDSSTNGKVILQPIETYLQKHPIFYIDNIIPIKSTSVIYTSSTMSDYNYNIESPLSIGGSFNKYHIHYLKPDEIKQEFNPVYADPPKLDWQISAIKVSEKTTGSFIDSVAFGKLKFEINEKKNHASYAADIGYDHRGKMIIKAF